MLRALHHRMLPVISIFINQIKLQFQFLTCSYNHHQAAAFIGFNIVKIISNKIETTLHPVLYLNSHVYNTM